LNVDDLFALEPTALVAERIHGTAMASLIAHRDRNAPELPLPRRIHFVPVLGANDQFPRDRCTYCAQLGADEFFGTVNSYGIQRCLP
jgi:hypothetical protein